MEKIQYKKGKIKSQLKPKVNYKYKNEEFKAEGSNDTGNLKIRNI